MPYGNTWRIHRRLFHRFLNVSVVDQFDDKIHRAVNVFLLRLFDSPERFMNHAHLYACPHLISAFSRAHSVPFCRGSLTGSLALSVTYGVNVESEKDYFYLPSGDAVSVAEAVVIPRAFFVDALPIRMSPSQELLPKNELNLFILAVKYVPEWFPGAGFQTFARTAKAKLDKLINVPFQHVKESLEVRETSLIVFHPGASLERTSGGLAFHIIDRCDVFRRTTGTQQKGG